MAIEKELLDQLLAGRDPQDMFARDGLVDELKKALSERLLNTGPDEHLVGDAGRATGNHRNGSSKKTMLTGASRVTLDIPRDRAGTFDPKLIARYQRRFPDFDEKIISMYVGLQTLRDWVLRFNARGPAGLINGKAPGNASKLNGSQRQALAAIVERGPIPAIHEVVRWRLADLAQWIWEEFGISLSETTVGREVQALGYREDLGAPAPLRAERTGHRRLQKKGFPAELDEIRERPPRRNRDRAVVAVYGSPPVCKKKRRPQTDLASAYPACSWAMFAPATMGAAGIRSLQDDQIFGSTATTRFSAPRGKDPVYWNHQAAHPIRSTAPSVSPRKSFSRPPQTAVG